MSKEWRRAVTARSDIRYECLVNALVPAAPKIGVPKGGLDAHPYQRGPKNRGLHARRFGPKASLFGYFETLKVKVWPMEQRPLQQDPDLRSAQTLRTIENEGAELSGSGHYLDPKCM